jgi:hypothetical protein
MSKNPKKKKRERQEQLKRHRQRQARKSQGHFSPEVANLLPPDMKLVHSVPGMPKMSDQLTGLVEPYIDAVTNDESMRKLLTVGMVTWNAALEPPAKRAAFLATFLDGFGGAGTPVAAEFLQIVGALVQRKEADPRFAEDHRFMLDFVLNETPSGPRLEVLSVLPGEESR